MFTIYLFCNPYNSLKSPKIVGQQQFVFFALRLSYKLPHNFNLLSKYTEARKLFNQEKIAGEVKDKTKKMFGNFMKKKGNKTDGSFNSGGTNTNQS